MTPNCKYPVLAKICFGHASERTCQDPRRVTAFLMMSSNTGDLLQLQIAASRSDSAVTLWAAKQRTLLLTDVHGLWKGSRGGGVM